MHSARNTDKKAKPENIAPITFQAFRRYAIKRRKIYNLFTQFTVDTKISEIKKSFFLKHLKITYSKEYIADIFVLYKLCTV